MEKASAMSVSTNSLQQRRPRSPRHTIHQESLSFVLVARGKEQARARNALEHSNHEGRLLKGIGVRLLHLFVGLKAIDKEDLLVRKRQVSDEVGVGPPAHHVEEDVVGAGRSHQLQHLSKEPVAVLRAELGQQGDAPSGTPSDLGGEFAPWGQADAAAATPRRDTRRCGST